MATRDQVYSSVRDLARYLDLVLSGRDPLDDDGANSDNDDEIPDGPILVAVDASLTGNKPSGAFAKLLSHAADITEGKVKRADLVFAVRALAQLGHLVGPDMVAEVVKHVRNAPFAGVEDAEERKTVALDVLADIATSVPIGVKPGSRIVALKGALAYAIETSQESTLVAQSARIASLVREWQMSDDDAREVLFNVASLHRDSDPQHLEYLIAYLSRFSDGSNAESVARAGKACACALSSESIFRFDSLLDCAPVQAAVASGSSPAATLLGAFATGRDIGTFNSAISSFFSGDSKSKDAHGISLSRDALAKKAVLMTVVSLAEGAVEAGKVLPFSEVARGIAVPDDEVEGWIIEAIGAGLVEGRMDQLEKVVHVKLAMPRAFDAQKQWPVIADAVKTWGENIDALIEVIRAAKKERAGALAAQATAN